MDVVDELVHGLRRDAERLRDFFGLRGAPETIGQLFLRGLQAASTRTHRTAGPVTAAQLVEQRTADASGGEAIERDAALRIEAARGLREAEHAGRHEVVAAHVVGHPVRNLGHDVLHERQVLAHELLFLLGLLDVDHRSQRLAGVLVRPICLVVTYFPRSRSVVLRSPNVSSRGAEALDRPRG